jgi:hypothetical protein
VLGVRGHRQQANVESASATIAPAVNRELTALSDEAARHMPDVGNIFLCYP